jgi:hypothetical protein
MGPQMNRSRDIAHFMLRSATDQGNTSVETKKQNVHLAKNGFIKHKLF